MAELKTRILLRSDTLLNWSLLNPVLSKGEAAVVFVALNGDNSFLLKIGDGVSSFNILPYIGISPEDRLLIEEAISKAELAITKAGQLELSVTLLDTKVLTVESNLAQEILDRIQADLVLQAEIDLIDSFEVRVVDELPEVGEEKVLYLVPKGSGKVGYNEYIWLSSENRFELIGDTEIDLTEYRKLALQDIIDLQLQSQINDKQDKFDIIYGGNSLDWLQE